MATTYSRLEITDGTTTITIESSTGASINYMLKYGGWSPNVARKRDVILGGQSPYYDVDEELVLNIKGSTPDDCFTKLDTLTQLLDQATRWYYRERVSPVVIRYQPKGSNLSTYLTALILRGAAIDRAIDLPKAFDDSGTTAWLLGVTIRFTRRGLWIAVLNTDNFNASGAQNTGTIWTMTSTQNPTLPAPITFLSGKPATATALQVQGYLMFCSDANQIGKIDASSFTGTHVTSVADVANKADGNIFRFTPTVINEDLFTNNLSLPNAFLSKTLGFYATVRVNTVATATFQVSVIGTQAGSGLSRLQTPFVPIQYVNAGSPQTVYLGSLTTEEIDVTAHRGFEQFGLEVIGPSSIAGTPTFDIDTIIILGLDDDYSYALNLNFKFGSLLGVGVRNSPTTLLNSEVFSYYSSPQQEMPIGYDGNPAVYTKGTNVSVCWLTVCGALWRLVDSGGTLVSITPNIIRNNSYLTPR